MEDEFAKRDIKVMANRAIQEIAPNEVILKDGARIPFRLSMFAPAMKGVPAIAPPEPPGADRRSQNGFYDRQNGQDCYAYH